MGNQVFAHSGIAQITLSKNLKAIPSGAFIDCTNLSEIEIPSSVRSVGGAAFLG